MRLEDEQEVAFGGTLEGDDASARPFAPQLRFDAAGQIILDEESLQVLLTEMFVLSLCVVCVVLVLVVS